MAKLQPLWCGSKAMRIEVEEGIDRIKLIVGICRVTNANQTSFQYHFYVCPNHASSLIMTSMTSDWPLKKNIWLQHGDPRTSHQEAMIFRDNDSEGETNGCFQK